MSILEELYYGNINPSAKSVKKGGAYQKCNKELTEHIDKLLLLLSDDQKELCEAIADKISDLGCIAEKECYIQGFRMGAQIILEIVYFQSNEFSMLFEL